MDIGRAAEPRAWLPCYPIGSYQVMSPRSHILSGQLYVVMRNYNVIDYATRAVRSTVAATCVSNKRYDNRQSQRDGLYCSVQPKNWEWAPFLPLDLNLSINRGKKRLSRYAGKHISQNSASLALLFVELEIDLSVG